MQAQCSVEPCAYVTISLSACRLIHNIHIVPATPPQIFLLALLDGRTYRHHTAQSIETSRCGAPPAGQSSESLVSSQSTYQSGLWPTLSTTADGRFHRTHAVQLNYSLPAGLTISSARHSAAIYCTTSRTITDLMASDICDRRVSNSLTVYTERHNPCSCHQGPVQQLSQWSVSVGNNNTNNTNNSNNSNNNI